jgi:hypothetical protein
MSSYGACHVFLHHSATNLEKPSGERVVGIEIVLVDKIVGCQMVTFQLIESPEERPEHDVEFTVSKPAEYYWLRRENGRRLG